MQRIEVSGEIKLGAALAAEEAEKTHKNKHLSVSDHQGLFAGYVGEFVFNDITGAKSVDGSYYHDTAINNFKIEVKTKQSTVKPSLYYPNGEPKWEGTVPCYLDSLHENPETRPDCFVFFNIKYKKANKEGPIYKYKVDDLECIYYGGYMTFDKYLEKRRYIPANEKYSTNDRLVHTDQWNIYWSELTYKELIKKNLTNSENLV